MEKNFESSCLSRTIETFGHVVVFTLTDTLVISAQKNLKRGNLFSEWRHERIRIPEDDAMFEADLAPSINPIIRVEVLTSLRIAVHMKNGKPFILTKLPKYPLFKQVILRLLKIVELKRIENTISVLVYDKDFMGDAYLCTKQLHSLHLPLFVNNKHMPTIEFASGDPRGEKHIVKYADVDIFCCAKIVEKPLNFSQQYQVSGYNINYDLNDSHLNVSAYDELNELSFRLLRTRNGFDLENFNKNIDAPIKISFNSARDMFLDKGTFSLILERIQSPENI